jgi:hypothetical protein
MMKGATMRSVFEALPFVIVVVAAFVFAGCGDKSKPASVDAGGDDAARADPIRQPTVELSKIEPDPKELDARQGEPLAVSGAFRVEDPSVKPSLAIVTFERPGKDGKPVIYNSAVGDVESAGDDAYSYRVELQAPKEKGDYSVRIKADGKYAAGETRYKVE